MGGIIVYHDECKFTNTPAKWTDPEEIFNVVRVVGECLEKLEHGNGISHAEELVFVYLQDPYGHTIQDLVTFIQEDVQDPQSTLQ